MTQISNRVIIIFGGKVTLNRPIWNTNVNGCEQNVQPNTCTPRHPPTHLHVTEYLPPSHHHLQPLHFSCLSFPFISLCTLRRQEELCLCYRGREGKVRPSPLLCLLLSFLSSVPPPNFYSLPPSFCLWHTAIGLEASEWGEARAELTHDDELLTLKLREPSAVGWLVAWTSREAVLLIIGRKTGAKRKRETATV